MFIGFSSADISRYAVSNAEGKFIFDGFPPGKYTVNIRAPQYSDMIELLDGPFSDTAVMAASR